MITLMVERKESLGFVSCAEDLILVRLALMDGIDYILQMPANGHCVAEGDTGDDEVVAEIDVLLTEELRHMYLVQYPHRPQDMPPFAPDEITNIR